VSIGPGDPAPILAGDFAAQDDPRGKGYTVRLDRPLTLVEGETYQLSLSLPPGGGAVALVGSSPAVETTWDDAIPLRMDGYDGYGGIYQGDLNFEMYWDDNPDKLGRFLNNLDRADYIFITSNRQWGTTTRVPERYPLTTEYYRRLLGCPAERSVVWCYDVAQVGTFKGDLGYELVQVFDSSPSLGPLVLNDQFAEERSPFRSPKVFIFRSRRTITPPGQRHSSSRGLHQKPYTSRPASGLLRLLDAPRRRWNQQPGRHLVAALQRGIYRTARNLWHPGVVSQHGVLGLAVFLAAPGLSGLAVAATRWRARRPAAALPGLAGRMVPHSFSRLPSGSQRRPGGSGPALAYRQRGAEREFRYRWRYFLLVEGLFLAFFLIDLLVRFGNPDLWHPAHGGEKPMDFSYFNAVLKSSSFPPYDPWFAGGYLNYYYYGFMLVGVLVKALGIVPSVAYNLILPTIFAMIAMGAFSLGWNLIEGRRTTIDDRPTSFGLRPSSFLVALSAALGMAVLGNLGTVRMIWRGYQMVAAPGGVIQDAGLLTRWIWSFQGFLKVLGGAALPYGIGDWYWIPSRAIPAPGDVEPITEFPIFTILYGDPHAHLFALPITLLVLSFALSIVLCRGRWESRLAAAAGFFLGALAVGAVRRPTLQTLSCTCPGRPGRWLRLPGRCFLVETGPPGCRLPGQPA
jgi:hypothetical protein